MFLSEEEIWIHKKTTGECEHKRRPCEEAAKGQLSASQGEASAETKPADILVLDFNLQLWEINCYCLNNPV